MNTPRFSEIELGLELPPVVQTYTQRTIDDYALATLDMNPVHVNIAWCERTLVFGTPKTVGHGMLMMSNMASAVVRHWGAVTAAGAISVRYVDAKFVKAIQVGDRVTATATVRAKHFHGEGKCWVDLAVKGVDSAGEVVCLGEVGINVLD
ncbi:MAG: MaoC family dehydratase [Afipia sp.]|jgi:phosphate acetyltransferase|nr:MaoC family dehydratase [Afipia sp.]